MQPISMANNRFIKKQGINTRKKNDIRRNNTLQTFGKALQRSSP